MQNLWEYQLQLGFLGTRISASFSFLLLTLYFVWAAILKSSDLWLAVNIKRGSLTPWHGDTVPAAQETEARLQIQGQAKKLSEITTLRWSGGNTSVTHQNIGPLSSA